MSCTINAPWCVYGCAMHTMLHSLVNIFFSSLDSHIYIYIYICGTYMHKMYVRIVCLLQLSMNENAL